MRSSSSCGGLFDVPVAEVQRSAALQRLEEERLVEPAVLERIAGHRQGRERRAERVHVRAALDRVERHLTAVGEAVGRGALDDTEAAQHLGADEVLGQEQPYRGAVVVRDQRRHPVDDHVDRDAVDGDDTLADVRVLVRLGDDVDAVGEVVHAQREEVERPRVRGVVEEDAAVPVALPERRQPEQADDELVARELRRLVRQRPCLGAKRLQRHLVIYLRVEVRHLRDETRDLALERGRPLRLVAAGTAREEQSDDDDPAHPTSERSADRHVKSDMSSLTAAQPQTRTVTASRSASKTTSVTSPTSSPSSCSGSGRSQRISIRSWSCSSTSCSLVRPVRM